MVLVTPSNPTGAVTPLGLERIMSEWAARDILILVDETYLRFVYDNEPATGWLSPAGTTTSS